VPLRNCWGSSSNRRYILGLEASTSSNTSLYVV
jgi:hypothetical protein